MARFFIPRVNVRRWAPPTAGFLVGYGAYHSQTREETFAQQIPLDMVRAYSAAAPLFRFLRGQSEITPEVKELLRCTRIMRFASDLGISSDTLRRHLLQMEANVGFVEEGSVERLTVLVEEMVRWRPDALLSACEAAHTLPEDPSVRALHRVLVATAKELRRESANAEMWTTRIYGADAELPPETIYTQKEDVDRLLALIAAKQSPGGRLWNFGAMNLDWVRWEYVLPISALGIIILLGQDGIGIASYRCHDVVIVAQRGGHSAIQLCDRSINFVRERFPDGPPQLPQHLAQLSANLPSFPSLPSPRCIIDVDYSAMAETCKARIHTHMESCQCLAKVCAEVTIRKADNLMELVRAHLGQSPLPPPSTPIEVD
eukprot:GEMP01027332.1.p1 GENE.GEMP01027332.1~~GEMP01027332.1.p1  ORF type:complete len:373 (+),score=72.87 GEMP01027332.1:115-1233(+)